MFEKDKIVRFDDYCLSCEYAEKKDYEDPCDECMNEPMTLSGYPACYKEPMRTRGKNKASNGNK